MTTARLTEFPPSGPDYRVHLSYYGPMPELTPDAAVEMISAAGLRGRGGAWFPASIKWEAVRRHSGVRRRRPVVVCNAMEGEPASSGDEWIASNHPHLIIDGVVAAARAVGARKSYIAVHEGSSTTAILRAALAQRPSGEGECEIVEAPARYVASEESALSHFLSGGPALPIFGTRPFEHGVKGRPTLVNNAETLSHAALILRHGAAWFRQVGTEDAPGTTLVSVGGDVGQARVIEIETGTPIRDLVAACGGAVGNPAGYRIAGFGGTWAGPDVVDMVWDPDAMRAAGLSAGAGILRVLTDRHCGIIETARTLDYLAGESAGQCGVCSFGLSSVSADYTALAACQADAGTLARLRERLSMIPRRGGCALPDGTVRMAGSALDVFDSEVQAHLNGSCSVSSYPAESWTPVPPARKHPVVAPGRHFQ